MNSCTDPVIVFQPDAVIHIEIDGDLKQIGDPISYNQFKANNFTNNKGDNKIV